MRKLFFIVISIFLITSCSKQEVILDSKIEEKINIINEKIFVVIPHHNLVNEEIDDYYKSLKDKYGEFNNVFIISPNHFNNDELLVLSSNLKYCYDTDKINCLNGKKFNYSGTGQYISNSFIQMEDYLLVKEHGIGNHFHFIDKYFSSSELYFALLKIRTKNTKKIDEFVSKINEYNFSGKTLFISSVDFSHHVLEKVAVFHDLNTVNFLNSGEKEKNVEVDCPNCLFLIKSLANLDNKNYFNLFNRTSVDKKLKINSNYQNTSHIYGEFSNQDIQNLDNSFSGTYIYSKFENLFSGSNNKNEITGMFFGDTHFTRGFTEKSNPNSINDYLKCFYSNSDLQKKPEFWHNRMFYSFDFVGVNLETSVGEKNECQKSNKSIVFQTKPEYLDIYKNIGINMYGIANNHSYDCGEIGFNSTKKYLTDKILLYYGNGRNDEKNVLKKEVNGTKIAFLGFNDIDLKLNEEDMVFDIKELNKDGYLVVVNIHWGFEYKTISNNRQRDLARKLIDAGANLIIGHHPHVVQENEIYKGVPIFYSLGNFIFDQPFEETLVGEGVVYSINGEGVKFNVINFKRDPKNYMINCDSFN